MKLEEIPDVIAECKATALRVIIDIVSAHGDFKFNYPTYVFGVDGIVCETFCADGVKDEEDELLVYGHWVSKYGGDVTEDDSFFIGSEDRVTTPLVLYMLATVMQKQDEAEPYENPMSFVGVSDWAGHYADERAERKAGLEEAYKTMLNHK